MVGDQRVLGLDRHGWSVTDGVGGEIPAGWYHWDVAYPFPPRRVPCFMVVRSGYDADRGFLDHLSLFWNISFEEPPKGKRLL